MDFLEKKNRFNPAAIGVGSWIFETAGPGGPSMKKCLPLMIPLFYSKNHKATKKIESQT